MANANQIGLASIMRSYMKTRNKYLYKELSYVIHSADKNPHKYGINKYTDVTCSYDKRVQVLLRKCQMSEH